MSAPLTTYEPNLSTREELAVSGAALSQAPWKLAGAAGVAALAMGAVAFFAVAGAGALVRTRHSRALRWARRRPWRYAAMPGAACAIVVFALMVLRGGGIGGNVFTALWHGGLAYGATGVVGTMVRPWQRKRT